MTGAPGRQTAAGRILSLLTETDGWVCARLVNSPEVGGWRGSARIAELRQDGYAIESSTCGPKVCARCRHAADWQRSRGRRPARVGRYRLRTAPKQQALAPHEGLFEAVIAGHHTGQGHG